MGGRKEGEKRKEWKNGERTRNGRLAELVFDTRIMKESKAQKPSGETPPREVRVRRSKNGKR